MYDLAYPCDVQSVVLSSTRSVFCEPARKSLVVVAEADSGSASDASESSSSSSEEQQEQDATMKMNDKNENDELDLDASDADRKDMRKLLLQAQEVAQKAGRLQLSSDVEKAISDAYVEMKKQYCSTASDETESKSGNEKMQDDGGDDSDSDDDLHIEGEPKAEDKRKPAAASAAAAQANKTPDAIAQGNPGDRIVNENTVYSWVDGFSAYCFSHGTATVGTH